MQTTTSTRQTQGQNRQMKPRTSKEKIDQLRSLIFEHEFSKISVDLRTTFTAGTRLAEGQWLEE
jgi:hypothetical protein